VGGGRGRGEEGVLEGIAGGGHADDDGVVVARRVRRKKLIM
jgi:hypothetical protein